MSGQNREEENTIVHYLYRDASNYKQWGAVVFQGRVTEEEVARLRAHCDDDDWFIAEQVGLEDLRERWPSAYGDDHIWHELADVELTDAPADQSEDIHAFVERFCATEWDIDAAHRRLEAFKAARPAGR